MPITPSFDKYPVYPASVCLIGLSSGRWEVKSEKSEKKEKKGVKKEKGSDHRKGWKASDLAIQRKRDPAKLALATRLRKETTLSIKGIAQRLHLGKPKGVNSNLHKGTRGNQLEDTAQAKLGI